MRWVPHWGVRKDVADIKHRSSTSPCGASHGRSSHVKSLSWHHLSFFFFLYMPDVSFPPTYWRKKKKEKYRHPPLTLLPLSHPVYPLPFFHQTAVLLPTLSLPHDLTTKPAPSICPDLLACSKVILPFSFPYMIWLFQQCWWVLWKILL